MDRSVKSDPVSIHFKPWMAGLSFGLLSLVTACATSTGDGVSAGAQLPPLSFFSPSEIIVGTRSTGTLKVVGRCLLFERVRPRGSRSPVLFPPGSTWIEGASAIRLPDGQSVTIGRAVEVAYESPPNARDTGPVCPGQPIHILNVVVKQ